MSTLENGETVYKSKARQSIIQRDGEGTALGIGVVLSASDLEALGIDTEAAETVRYYIFGDEFVIE